MADNSVKILYKEIQNILFKIIPERWESLYLYASVVQGKGEMYFYYFPKKRLLKSKPINCYEIAGKFGLSEEQYNIVLNNLYGKIKELNNVSTRKWTNITISIVNCLFTVEYNYNDLLHSAYTDEQRHIYWEYKYLHIPIETLSKENQNLVKYYIDEQNTNTSVYTEGIYIQNKSDKEQVDEITKEINNANIIKQMNNNTESSKEIRNQILKY